MNRLFVLLFLVLLACETSKSPYRPEFFAVSFDHPIDSTHVVKLEDEMLFAAFDTQSQTELELFCDNWLKEYLDVAQNSNPDNEIIKEIYKLFYDFYFPSEGYGESKYLVLQNEIQYIMIDSSYYNANLITGNSQDSLINIEPFWPEIRDTGQNILYLTEKYNKVLNFYISEYSVNENQYNYEWHSWEYIQSKVNFLAQHFVLMHNHWIPAYHYYSFPYISMVIFNEDEPRAFIFYRDSWSTGGADEYEKYGSEWVMKKSIFKWIE